MSGDHYEGLGITRQELVPGTVVMVPVGRIAAAVNGQPCIIAWAVVVGPVKDAGGPVYADHIDKYWLDVYVIPGGPPLPQMYRAEEILGVPALGLRMQGAPEPDVIIRNT